MLVEESLDWPGGPAVVLVCVDGPFCVGGDVLEEGRGGVEGVVEVEGRLRFGGIFLGLVACGLGNLL